jgi:uncharacterized protein YkwD
MSGRTVGWLRVRILVWVALAPAAIFALTPETATAAAPTRTMVSKIDAFRAARGLPRLRVSGSLRKSARRYSHHLMRRGVFAHAARIQASRRFRTLGEILEIHYDRRARATFAFHQWLRSPSHRAAILNSSFRWIGAGRTAGRFRGHGATIWVVHFGRR